MHEPHVNYQHRIDLSSGDCVWPASSYLISEVANCLGVLDNNVQPAIAMREPHVTLNIEVPQSKLQRLEERIKAIEKHFAEQGWLKSVPT